MALKFVRLSAGFYVWDAPHKMITIEKKRSKWFVTFVKKNNSDLLDDRRGEYEASSFSKAIEFANFFFDDFEAMLID